MPWAGCESLGRSLAAQIFILEWQFGPGLVWGREKIGCRPFGTNVTGG